MTTAQIEAGTLTASAEDRTVTGLLLPYGEVGNTNLGKFSIDKGAVRIPRDPAVVTANLDHLQHSPVGRATSLTETDAGIVATFSIADTDEGDALLAELASDEPTARKRLSVEVSGIVLRAGKAIAGSLFGAAFVAKGAFPSAALMAADIGDFPDDAEVTPPAPLQVAEDGSLDLATDTTPDVVNIHAADSDEPVSFIAQSQEDTVATASVPNTLEASATSKPRALSVSDMAGLLYAANQGTLSDEGHKALEANNGSRLFAALSDIVYDGTGGLAPTMSVYPQWIDQVWQATKYSQQVVPLFDHADLTSLTISGFKYGTKPAGGTWAGNKAAVPSNTITVTPVSATADRYAVGHDIAREFVDFNTPGFFESYAAAVSEDYSRWVDTKVATAVTAGATALAGAALTTLPGVAGGTIGSAASAIIDGAAALVTQGTLPTFALVSPALWLQMVKTPQSNVTGYINTALGLSEGDLGGFIIRPSASIAAGKVLVGAKQAVTVYELPGAPIRIDALDLARGGVDKAAFGYAGVVINDTLGLRLVTAATA